jgi:3-oxoacyl-[acyl-carrier protein] reductase
VTAGRYDERVVVVTGGGQGIGRAFCLAYAREGARVVVADLAPNRADSVAAEIRAAGGQALGLTVDVTDQHSVVAMTRAAAAEFGGIDLLVNNAAIFTTLELARFEEISQENWDAVMSVNVWGVFCCCQAAAPYLRASSRGAVITISSGMIAHGRPGYAHYVTSKSALIGLTRTLATELGADDVTVNAIMPGATKTEVPRASLSDAQIDEVLQAQAIHRWGTTDDIVGTALFLGSDEARFITGQSVIVDGGHDYQ